MVTYAKTIQDIEHIVKLINIHITYIVICLDKNRDVNLTDSYLNSILIMVNPNPIIINCSSMSLTIFIKRYIVY